MPTFHLPVNSFELLRRMLVETTKDSVNDRQAKAQIRRDLRLLYVDPTNYVTTQKLMDKISVTVPKRRIRT